ncbi:RNA polymerase sigma factor [Nitratireductor sp. StC3]|uniref:RNA polymerase sigma factor n=1 Tax=Nitratireductor sp. StC3 TaxID=2126741 RepID=UPI000D0DED32|nr:RNA polymerase sigma factor [Nitratireductor sp. StC3]PSM17478.1 RNA polymerase subunit sigma [Nitratireductor sp. StC3]
MEQRLFTRTEPAPADDADLVARARSGSEEAVRLLVRKNNRLLFRLARGFVHDDAEAEDVVQETYVRAFSRLDGFRGEAAVSTWLSRIAINEALGRLRKRRPMADLAELETGAAGPAGDNVVMFPIVPSAPDPETETAREQIRATLERAVDMLPPAFRTVFILRDVEGMSTEETAAHLSIRPETAKTRLHRARRLLKRAIEKELSAGFADLFPFDGDRCAHMADKVIERLGQSQ